MENYENRFSLLWNPEAEREIIGSLLLNGNFEGLDDLVENHFFDKSYGTAYAVMRKMSDEGKVIDLFGVAEALGGGAVEAKLIDAAQNSIGHKLGGYAEKVIEKAKARHAVRMAQDFIDSVRENNGRDVMLEVQALTRGLDEMAVSKSDNEATLDACDLFRIGVEEFDRRIQQGGGFVGLETGLKALDEKLMGLQGGSLYVMGGRPGMGKTAVSMTIAENIAEKYADKGAVLVFNLEMSKEQLGFRTAAAAANVSLSDLQKGYEGGQGENFTKLTNAVGRVMKRKMFVDVRADITVSKIKAKAQQIKNKHGLTLIVIDYLGLLEETGRKFETENARIAWLSRQIKKIAKQLDVPVLLLAQLSRGVEQRSDKRPMMSDLRDSGAIEQDADAIIFNYREGYYTKDPNDNMIELIVAKQRMGETGTAYCCFEGRYSRVVDVADEYVDYIFRQRNGGGNESKRRTA